MWLKIIKIATIVAFMSIIFQGEHLGGPLIMYLIAGLFSDLPGFIASCVSLVVLSVMGISMLPKFKSVDLYLFAGGGIILIGLVIYMLFRDLQIHPAARTTVYLTSLPFFTFYFSSVFIMWLNWGKIKKIENE